MITGELLETIGWSTKDGRLWFINLPTGRWSYVPDQSRLIIGWLDWPARIHELTNLLTLLRLAGETDYINDTII